METLEKTNKSKHHHDETGLKPIEMAFTAVMTEYTAIREFSNSRDQSRGNLLNFFYPSSYRSFGSY